MCVCVCVEAYCAGNTDVVSRGSLAITTTKDVPRNADVQSIQPQKPSPDVAGATACIQPLSASADAHRNPGPKRPCSERPVGRSLPSFSREFRSGTGRTSRVDGRRSSNNLQNWEAIIAHRSARQRQLICGLGHTGRRGGRIIAWKRSITGR